MVQHHFDFLCFSQFAGGWQKPMRSLHVQLHVALLCEANSAHFTSVGLLACVFDSVHLQSTFLIKCFVTQRTLERPLACVCAIVSFQLTGFSEGFVTVGAFEHSGLGIDFGPLLMNILVLLEVCCSFEGFIADMAYMTAVFSMCLSAVSSQRICCQHQFTAVVALVLPPCLRVLLLNLAIHHLCVQVERDCIQNLCVR